MFAQFMREGAYSAYRDWLETLLQIPVVATDQDIHELIEAGFSAEIVSAFCDHGLIGSVDLESIISSKTLEMRLAGNQRLTLDESDRLFRVAHIIAMANTFFGDCDIAKRWLSKPKDRFSGKSSMAMLSTTQGTRTVEEMLIQVAEGFTF